MSATHFELIKRDIAKKVRGSEALITSQWSSEEFDTLYLQAWSKIEFDMVHTPMSMFMGSEGVLTRKSNKS